MALEKSDKHRLLKKLNDHRLKAVGFVAAESRFEAKAS
jgi:hypothetical protein